MENHLVKAQKYPSRKLIAGENYLITINTSLPDIQLIYKFIGVDFTGHDVKYILERYSDKKQTSVSEHDLKSMLILQVLYFTITAVNESE